MHPWKEYIPEDANKLILGTFPPRKEQWDFDFYYPNKKNKFWKVLAEIAGYKLKDFNESISDKVQEVEEKKYILRLLKLGITDIALKIIRQKNSSLDQNLFLLEFRDIFQILDQNPKIQTLILTSSSNGNSVLTWFEIYSKLNNIALKWKLRKQEFPKEAEISIQGKDIQIKIVNSTSGTAGKSLDFLVKQYKRVL